MRNAAARACLRLLRPRPSSDTETDPPRLVDPLACDPHRCTGETDAETRYLRDADKGVRSAGGTYLAFLLVEPLEQVDVRHRLPRTYDPSVALTRASRPV